MTWDQYTDKWKKLKADLKKESGKEILAVPAATMLSSIKTRVFTHGVTTYGEQMQEYSTKPRGFLQRDFADKSAFKPNKPGGRVMFLEDGYKELRDIQGFQTSFIDLKYTGKFREDYSMRVSGSKIQFRLDTQRAVRLREEHENRFGAFLFATFDEKENYSDAVIPAIDQKVLTALTT